MKSVAISVAIAGSVAITGCATTPPPEKTKPVIVYRTKDSFCKVMKGLFPATGGKPRWSVKNAAESIRDSTDLELVVDSKCTPKKGPTS